jgi:hypothetical protein
MAAGTAGITIPIVNAKIDQATDDLDTTGAKWTFISADFGGLLLWRPAGEFVKFPAGSFLSGACDRTQTKTRQSDGQVYSKLCDGYQVIPNPQV